VKVLSCSTGVAELRESLRDLAVASDGKTRRTFAVVGGMPGGSDAELMDLGRFVVRLDISALVAVGDAGLVHAGAVLEGSWGSESRHVPSAEDALALLRSEVAVGDVVLVAGLPDVLSALCGVGGTS
jgi:UDP-N-acetylmuramoyl-tripeptide--D-alanyl-D-alanine ligase